MLVISFMAFVLVMIFFFRNHLILYLLLHFTFKRENFPVSLDVITNIPAKTSSLQLSSDSFRKAPAKLGLFGRNSYTKGSQNPGETDLSAVNLKTCCLGLYIFLVQ